jgi:kumamolisin
LASYYSFPAQNNPGSPPKIAIISLGGTYLTKDLKTYWTTYLGQSGNPNVTYVNRISGSRNRPDQRIRRGDGSDENTLDIEIAMGICPAAQIIVYFGPNSLVGFYNAIARAISDGNKIISISWGASESAFGANNLNSYNQLFANAAAQGVAICVASGDNCASDGNSTLTLDFPSCSPYAIACGGTSLSSPESVWSYNPTYGWGTGGGLSNFFTSIRDNAVQYPALGSTTPNIDASITAKRRSSPDIALNGDPLTGWTIYFNGTLYTSAFGGTSCVSPAFSGFLGLVNKNYGTSNPTNQLYDAYLNGTGCYNDITIGNNNDLPNTANVYVARVGFDQCSGMGTINGTNLANYILTH